MFSNTLLVIIGSYILFIVLSCIIQEKQLNISLYKDSYGNLKKITYGIILRYLLTYYPLLFILFIINIILSIPVTILFRYHLKLACSNITLNEYVKRKRLQLQSKKVISSQDNNNLIYNNMEIPPKYIYIQKQMKNNTSIHNQSQEYLKKVSNNIYDSNSIFQNLYKIFFPTAYGLS